VGVTPAFTFNGSWTLSDTCPGATGVKFAPVFPDRVGGINEAVGIAMVGSGVALLPNPACKITCHDCALSVGISSVGIMIVLADSDERAFDQTR
jgi:hypothetical protein